MQKRIPNQKIKIPTQVNINPIPIMVSTFAIPPTVKKLPIKVPIPATARPPPSEKNTIINEKILAAKATKSAKIAERIGIPTGIASTARTITKAIFEESCVQLFFWFWF